MRTEWNGFIGGDWEHEINVRDFIQKNYTPYEGDESFLAGPTKATNDLWAQVMELTEEEHKKGGVLDMDTHIISTITSHGPGYLNKEKETIVGFQTDKPFKRALQPNGGIRMAIKACEDNGYHVDPEIVDFYTKYRKTHNDGVFDVYSPEMRACRSSHIITGLPDAYGRGRIIGDYRRVALYGVDRLIEDKEDQKAGTRSNMYEDVIRGREELSEQIKALKELKKLGEIYGFDISKPAKDVKEAIQWLYFGYLAAIKEQNGAAMSLGRTSTFLDIYAERDLREGTFTEEEIQEFASRPQIEFVEIPKRLYFQVNQALDAACIRPVQEGYFPGAVQTGNTVGDVPGQTIGNITENQQGLSGQGVLVGIVDSGVDWQHPALCNKDGTSRILRLWDQSLLAKPGEDPPEGYAAGVEYTKTDIDRALRLSGAEGKQIVREQDFSGHGTSVLGIAAGNGRASGGVNRGVAYTSDIIAVKMGMPGENSFPRTAELMQGVDYLVRQAAELGRPMAVNISFGNNYGSHEPYN